jgi:TonB family protein
MVPTFAQLAATPKRAHALRYGSVIFHCLLLAWLVRSPAPIFVAPAEVARGNNGTATMLYWPARSLAGAKTTAPESSYFTRHQQSVAKALFYPEQKPASHPAHSTPRANYAAAKKDTVPTEAIASNAFSQAPPAGSSYGSLALGNPLGEEIRPAFWASGSDPIVTPMDLAGGIEGNVVVEITIDEQGNVIQTAVLESLGPGIDAKVVEAVRNWRFRPATRDGVPIASKQDVYYHFPARQVSR